MPVLIQVCAVIITIALVAIAIVTIRTMMRFEKAAHELSATAVAIRNSLGQIEAIVAEVRDVVNSVRQVVPHLQRTVERIEGIGERAADLADAALAEIEGPLSIAIGVSRGVKSGAGQLVERLTRGLSGKLLSWWEGRGERTRTSGRKASAYDGDDLLQEDDPTHSGL